jgi:hypothetical protein
MRRSQFEDQLGQKVIKTFISTNRTGKVACVYNPSYIGGIGRKIAIKGCSQVKMREAI